MSDEERDLSDDESILESNPKQNISYELEDDDNDLVNKKKEMKEDDLDDLLDDDLEDDSIDDLSNYENQDEDDDEDDDEDKNKKKKNKSKTQEKEMSEFGDYPELDDDEEDDEDEEEEYDENYLKKIDEDIKKNVIQDYHPEIIQHNYEEIEALTKIVRNEQGIVIDPLHKTLPFITKYEKARILGDRAKQINAGAKPFVPVEPFVIDGYLIALKEFEEKKIPFIIKRPLPNGGTEYWKLKDLEILV
jgi:DNA-directed RNA polymerase I, II, and III subunit RPABC2